MISHPPDLAKTPPQAVVAVASSADEELGELGAPLDGDLRFEQVDAVVRRALGLDDSPGCLKRTVGQGDWVVLKPNLVRF